MIKFLGMALVKLNYHKRHSKYSAVRDIADLDYFGNMQK